jgi:hypothetical protein
VSTIPVATILWPLLAQIGWTFLLYAWLTVARQRAVTRGIVDYGCFVLGRDEPREIARITRNLTNQFELPVIFYALVVLLRRVRTSDDDRRDRRLGIRRRPPRPFVVQTLTDNVPLRGRVFMINFLAVVVLAARVAQVGFEGGLRCPEGLTIALRRRPVSEL